MIDYKKILTSVIGSSQAYVLANLIYENDSPVVFIAKDEHHIRYTAKIIKFFNSSIKLNYFLPYDTLPYDRMSPSSSVLSSRVKSLYTLLANEKSVIFTTHSALMQYTIPRHILARNILKITQGNSLNREDLIKKLITFGFSRNSIASNNASFAVRGSIIDIFESTLGHGYRIDFFGDEVETIKIYDGISQISTDQINHLLLLPSNEVIFDNEYINNFKYNYLQLFGISRDHEILDIINHHTPQGIEHWLPLFYNKLDSFFDYLPNDAILVSSNEADQIIANYNNSITSYYNMRFDAIQKIHTKDDFIYRPVKRDLFWFDQETYIHQLNQYDSYRFSEFKEDLVHSKDMGFYPVPNFSVNAKNAKTTSLTLFKDFYQKYHKKFIITANSQGSLVTLQDLLYNNNISYKNVTNLSDVINISTKIVGLTVLPLNKGFIADNFIVISENDLLANSRTKTASAVKRLGNLLNESAALDKGEFVIHLNHGIGRFEGLQTLDISGNKHDFILLVYDGGDKLFLPVENIDLISKFGDKNDQTRLDKLGMTHWQERKAKAKKKLKEIAQDLVNIAAARKLKTTESITVHQDLYNEFCTRFKFIETDDQLKSIRDVESDLASGKVMDRLICGDVGFGKTEVALRAAFMVTKNNQNIKLQVAIIVPTTILCRQHYENFIKRFEGFNLNIKELSRIVKPKESKIIKQDIANGEVDIIIGTHALLASNITFKNLALLVIDEEQHFGVKQKEKLKNLKNDTHVITLSATPIPRTMQMSLVGIRELSLIATPPIDRLAVKTYVMFLDAIVIKEAIMREINRGGKCLFVVPRISDLDEINTLITKIVPDVRVVTAHGKLLPNTLDRLMHDFYEGKYQLLISTAIIESGLDIQGADTIFIYKANAFGLSALYQLRGRVGRGKKTSFAYLLLQNNKKLTGTAKKRLQVMQMLDSLGVGFSIATQDMDIRGFGNLLGKEQSGQIKEIGVELYQSMLAEAIESINNKEIKDMDWSPQINIGIPVRIPEDYITDIDLRMGIYRRAAALTYDEDIINFKSEMINRFGALPQDFDYLLLVVKLKIRCKSINIEKLDANENAVVIAFKNNYFAEGSKLFDLSYKSKEIKIRPDQKIIFTRKHEDIVQRIEYVFSVIKKLQEL